MSGARWPEGWQVEVIDVIEAFVDTDYRVDIWIGDPATSLGGSLIDGYVITGAHGQLKIVHDRTGRHDVYPWPLSSVPGPVLRVTAHLPGRRRSVVYIHPDWSNHPPL
jgi:hypothetical protein